MDLEEYLEDLKAMKNLEAGRELDALVAEKVMGWTVALEDRGPCRVWRPHENSAERSQPIPPYSTSIEAAWEVVEKMRQREFGFSLNDAWIAWFLAAPNEYQADADTAPHAICLAALKAVGVDV